LEVIMAIHPAYRTAKQGKDDALRVINAAKSGPGAAGYYARLIVAISVRFGTAGSVKDCTAAYRRAFFDKIAQEF
jgi:2-phospho-L-lactate guanylyltransferase (CobY/MobA/RfbA family)